MPDLTYVYMPVYGVEPYLDNNGLGGATVTGNNLVITAWQTLGKFGTPPAYMSFDQILLPASMNTNVPPQDGVAGLQAFSSRHSSKIYLNGALADAVDPIDAVVFVINPPPEMKQLLAGAVSYNGGNPLDFESYTVRKSLQAAYVWRSFLATMSAHNTPVPTSAGMAFSSYIPYSDLGGDDTNRVPFLTTNGADGVAPIFFDASISSGMTQMVEAVNDGDDYYVALSMSTLADPEDPSGSYLDIEYPHSVARG